MTTGKRPSARQPVRPASHSADQPGGDGLPATLTDGQPDGQADSGFELLVIDGGAHRTLALPPGGSWIVGRDDVCDLVLRHPDVSRRHAAMHVSDTLVVEDLGSANGTRVGKHRLPAGESRALDEGDVVRFGSVTAVVRRRRVGVPATPAVDSPTDLLMRDPAMLRIAAIVDRIAPSQVSVLILGETGVGKELIANLVHSRSPRRAKPFVRLNCAAFAELLLESELFGYEKGAFTGATNTKPGLLETAQGGTVFLDEVGEMSPGTQAKVLRALETREVVRVGGLRPRSIDVRFVSATNRDLDRMTREGRFRRDLFFRLNGLSLFIPPLRARPGEIPLLARNFVIQACQRNEIPELPLSDGAIAALEAHDWPGNVRELRNVIERAVLLTAGPAIEAWDLALGPPADAPSLPTAAASGELGAIMAALERCAFNQSRAADELGISRRTLVRKIAQYRIPRPRKPHEGSHDGKKATDHDP